MGDATFYHVTDRPEVVVLRQVLARALGEGWRVELRGASREALAALDLLLWEPPESFLPHALAGGPQDAAQPVLLTVAPAGDGRECLLSVDGAALSPDEVRASARALVVFDGRTGVERARAQWRELERAGVGLQYWAEEGGRWVRKQERPARPPTQAPTQA